VNRKDKDVFLLSYKEKNQIQTLRGSDVDIKVFAGLVQLQNVRHERYMILSSCSVKNGSSSRINNFNQVQLGEVFHDLLQKEALTAAKTDISEI